MSISKNSPRDIYDKLEDNTNALSSLTELLSNATQSSGVNTSKLYYLLSALVDKQVELVNQLSQLN